MFEQYPDLPIVAAHAGSCWNGWSTRHPEYIDRVRTLVERGRIEIVGGAFYEPILAMIPRRDRVGQITRLLAASSSSCSARRSAACGCPSGSGSSRSPATSPQAGIEYTMLDDFHFKNAGLRDDELHGYYLTEDDGRLLAIFPGSERLRYTIPFAEPQETIDYLREIADKRPERGGGVRRRRREVRHLARDEEARLQRRLAAAVLRRAAGQPRLAQGRHARPRRSTRRRRSARSTCPTAATAR